MQSYHTETRAATAADLRFARYLKRGGRQTRREWDNCRLEPDPAARGPMLDEAAYADADAPAEPEPTGHDAADEAWWEAYCLYREDRLERQAREQPVTLTEADWDAYGAHRLEEQRVAGYWAGYLDERGDR